MTRVTALIGCVTASTCEGLRLAKKRDCPSSSDENDDVMDLAVVVAENSLVVVLRLGQKDIGILSKEEDESWLLQEGWVPKVTLTSPCESLL